MRKFFKFLYIFFSFLFLIYLILPAPKYPDPPPDSLQSNEPGDTEDLAVRRAYFTDYSRQEVLEYYESQLERLGSFNFDFLTYRLNYPPEEAKVIIRDQTRSTFLEEIIHPFRESFFVNGFEAKDPKDTILIEGKVWRQKITVKYVKSNPSIRTVLGFLSLILLWFLIFEWEKTIKKIKKVVSKW
jgi:hypothetical protein